MDVDETTAGEEFKPALTRNVRFRVTLPVDPESVPMYYGASSITKGPGLLFPYVPELARFDRYTVPEVIKKYFFGCLGENLEECIEEFAELVSAWGNIVNSTFANEITHLYKIIDISLMTQCVPHVMSNGGTYDGVFMRGWGFRIQILGKTYEAASQEDVEAELPNMDSHANAFWKILKDLDMLEDVRLVKFRTVRSIWGLKELVDTHKLNGGTATRDRAIKNAKALRFPDNRLLEPTAANITLVLSYIADPRKDITELPWMHAPFLFETDRVVLCWSAFGQIAPSFRVPGGKEMYIDRPFRVTNAKLQKEKGATAHRDVTKIGCTLLPIELAITHIKQVKELKTILNPFGNAVVVKSASHINKEFEGDSCQMILNALRGYAKVTVADVGSSKRKERDETRDESISKKRLRF